MLCFSKRYIFFHLRFFGALTSKIYTFQYRSWDLKKGFFFDTCYIDGLSLQIEFKYNKVVRVLPNLVGGFYWLTNKSRFFFNKMYINIRLVNSRLHTEWGLVVNLGWLCVFELLIYIFRELRFCFIKYLCGVIFFKTLNFFKIPVNIFSFGLKIFDFVDLSSIDFLIKSIKLFIGVIYVSEDEFFSFVNHNTCDFLKYFFFDLNLLREVNVLSILDREYLFKSKFPYLSTEFRSKIVYLFSDTCDIYLRNNLFLNLIDWLRTFELDFLYFLFNSFFFLSHKIFRKTSSNFLNSFFLNKNKSIVKNYNYYSFANVSSYFSKFLGVIKYNWQYSDIWKDSIYLKNKLMIFLFPNSLFRFSDLLNGFDFSLLFYSFNGSSVVKSFNGLSLPVATILEHPSFSIDIFGRIRKFCKEQVFMKLVNSSIKTIIHVWETLLELFGFDIKLDLHLLKFNFVV